MGTNYLLCLSRLLMIEIATFFGYYLVGKISIQDVPKILEKEHYVFLPFSVVMIEMFKNQKYDYRKIYIEHIRSVIKLNVCSFYYHEKLIPTRYHEKLENCLSIEYTFEERIEQLKQLLEQYLSEYVFGAIIAKEYPELSFYFQFIFFILLIC